MVFTTLPFIAFFALVFFAYYLIPAKRRWWLLLTASWFFYAYATPYYLIFLGITTVATYLAAIGISANLQRQAAWIVANGKSVGREEKKAYKAVMERKRQLMVTGAIVILLGMLIAFKYLEFLFRNIGWLGGAFGYDWSLPTVNWILPIGLSFYVFQSLGYCIDVAREAVPAERNFFRHALFVSYFPQILQGPIGDYGRLAPQLFGEHVFDYEQVVFGIQRVAWGFFKKLCVANMIAYRINPVWTSCGDYPGFLFWMMMAFLYAIQLYADFSGYMDIACGCSQMLGIRLDENFDCPYFSRTIAEFWRRWHMTLGAWFKNYVFYPILRSDSLSRLRKHLKGHDYLANTMPTAVALLVVWLLIGLWHGADWAYVLYGLFHGSFIIMAVVLKPLYDRFNRTFPRVTSSRLYAAFQMARTFVIVMVGYLIFKPADLGVTTSIFKSMLLDGGVGALQGFFVSHMKWLALTTALCGLVLVVDVVHLRCGAGVIRRGVRKFPLPIRWGLYLGGVWLLLLLMRSDIQTFEYFRF